jgi:hypothetical protein
MIGLTPGGSSTSHIYTQTVHIIQRKIHIIRRKLASAGRAPVFAIVIMIMFGVCGSKAYSTF